MEIPGYVGNILFIDLTYGRVSKEPLDAALIRTYLGGAGINNKLAYSLIPPEADPLSPENAIIIGTGPFSGTIIPGSSELMITYKSPLNGAFPYSCGGGKFAAFLKSSGYDHVVITGRSDKPVYLKIEDENIKLHDASDLWGRDSFETTDILMQRHEPCSVIPIGPSGENLVNISVSHIDKGGTVGSGGLAAVMGSKNLKAIVVVMGTKGVTVAHPRRLRKLVDDILSRVNSYHRRPEMMLGGAMAMTSGWVPEGGIARNSSTLIPYQQDAGEIQAQIYEIHKRSRKKIACMTCPMSDKDRIDLVEHGMMIYDTAIMAERAIMTTSPAFGHSDSTSPLDRYAEALSYFDLANRYGIDRIYSFRGLADFVISLYEDGIITKEDTGMELNRELSTIIKLVKITALREGFGDVLADGPVKAARRIGKNAEKHLQNVIKGQFVAFDPRLSALGSTEFAQLTHPGRCFGVAGALGAPTYSLGWPLSEYLKQAKRCGVSEEAMGRIFTEGSFNAARLAKHAEDFFCVFNILGQCHRLYISRFYSVDVLAELYSAVTGIEVTAADLKVASERAWNIWKLLNYRAGFDRKDDEPPEIWFQPLKGVDKDYVLMDYFHNTVLTREDVEGLLDDYYEERGWDKHTSAPTPTKLRQLGLDSFARDVES
ncbi:MAG: aldehyde ferredoxin oxidoreductase N-terminal domain-containing protein [Chloroflexota bacterium]|nr:aldehyde ferredoxin oxidoreductase N-terminal domain-containing protein [Chloroflexota bacterium]